MRQHTILLADDDPFILKTVGPSLESEGYSVVPVTGGAAAIEYLEENKVDLVLTDLVMGEPDGIEVLRRAKELDGEVMVIILTGYADLSSAIEALRLSADDYLRKPCDPAEIHFRVGRCIEKLEFRRRIRAYERILPVCCKCKKIRDDTGREPGQGDWLSVEKYMWRRAGLASSSTYCPECMAGLRRELGGILGNED